GPSEHTVDEQFLFLVRPTAKPGRAAREGDRLSGEGEEPHDPAVGVAGQTGPTGAKITAELVEPMRPAGGRDRLLLEHDLAAVHHASGLELPPVTGVAAAVPVAPDDLVPALDRPARLEVERRALHREVGRDRDRLRLEVLDLLLELFDPFLNLLDVGRLDLGLQLLGSLDHLVDHA